AMMVTKCVSPAARLLLAATLVAVPLMARAEPKLRTRDGISYVSGGVSDEERRALEAMSERFNLKLTMALASGHFVGDAQVRLLNAQGQTVLDIVADGPLL